jgi:anti-anti-sigma factor
MTVDPGRTMGGTAALTVTLDSDEHGLVVARVAGALDIASTSKLDAELSAALAEGPCAGLVLDVSGVGVLDSTGLRALWTIRHAMREVGAPFVLRRPSPAVLHVLEATGLTAEFEIG